MSAGPVVLVAMPTRGHAYVPSVLQAIEFARRGSHGRVAPLFEVGGPVDAVRTRIVERFLETGATHLMMLDDDVVAPDETLERLLDLEAPIATAACPFGIGGQVFVNAKRNAGREWPTRPGGTVESVRQAGLACSIIARSVFERVPPPWFVMGTDSTGRYVIGEDVWFCNRAIDAGLSIVCDSTIVCSHVKDGIDLAVLAGWKAASETGPTLAPANAAGRAADRQPGYMTARSR